MKRVAILISGGGSNMVSLVNAMQRDQFADPVLVLSNVPDAGGLAKAAELGLATAIVNHKEFSGDRAAFEAAVSKELAAAEIDIVCLAGFMRVLGAGFVEPWEGRMLNIHPSILPKYKGLNTHQRALDAGDAEHGCTVHGVTAVLDDGPIHGQAFVNVLENDTAETLAARVLPCEHELYPAVLRRFVSGATGTMLIDKRQS